MNEERQFTVSITNGTRTSTRITTKAKTAKEAAIEAFSKENTEKDKYTMSEINKNEYNICLHSTETNFNIKVSELCDCGHTSAPSEYGINKDNKKICYECCAKRDEQDMQNNTHHTLYISEDKKFVTNWPGTLKIPITHIKEGKHNIAKIRLDIWFNHQGQYWHGVNYGNTSYNQLVNAKKIKPPIKK